jgi:hypothetical protein
VRTGTGQDRAPRPDAYAADECVQTRRLLSGQVMSVARSIRRGIGQSRNQSLTFQPGRPIERSVWFRRSLRATSFWARWKPGISNQRRLYSGRHFSHSQGLNFAARPFRSGRQPNCQTGALRYLARTTTMIQHPTGPITIKGNMQVRSEI